MGLVAGRALGGRWVRCCELRSGSGRLGSCLLLLNYKIIPFNFISLSYFILGHDDIISWTSWRNARWPSRLI